jgi:hypothetical protein
MATAAGCNRTDAVLAQLWKERRRPSTHPLTPGPAASSITILMPTPERRSCAGADRVIGCSSCSAVFAGGYDVPSSSAPRPLGRSSISTRSGLTTMRAITVARIGRRREAGRADQLAASSAAYCCRCCCCPAVSIQQASASERRAGSDNSSPMRLVTSCSISPAGIRRPSGAAPRLPVISRRET